MLTICAKDRTRTCAGLHRRELLRIGALGFGALGFGALGFGALGDCGPELAGLSLPELLAAREAERSGPGFLKGKSVVLLFLHGGPPHIEFFDPKMTAPAEIRSITGEVQTSIPGVTFGGTFPQLASRTDMFSIVRSYGSKNAAHTYGRVASGENPTGATMSAIYARLAGSNHPRTGMPRNVHLPAEAVRAGLKLGRNFETGALPTVVTAGELGKTYQAFDPSGGGPLTDAMQLKIAPQRLTDRRRLLADLDHLRKRAERSTLLTNASRYQQQAFEMITRGIARAFDLSQEDPKTLARYDTTQIFRMEELTRYYDMRRASNLLGRQMLLARRLCEAGCGFVTVSDCGWDYHANNNSPKQMAGMWPMGHQVDHAVAAFLDDVRGRGLQDDILLIVTGEMGRTPRINRNGGRDHYGELTSLLVAGGGIPGGQVIGQSDRSASRPTDSGFTPRHLFGTVMHALFDVGQVRLETALPTRLRKVIAASQPIRGLSAR